MNPLSLPQTPATLVFKVLKSYLEDYTKSFRNSKSLPVIERLESESVNHHFLWSFSFAQETSFGRRFQGQLRCEMSRDLLHQDLREKDLYDHFLNNFHIEVDCVCYDRNCRFRQAAYLTILRSLESLTLSQGTSWVESLFPDPQELGRRFIERWKPEMVCPEKQNQKYTPEHRFLWTVSRPTHPVVQAPKRRLKDSYRKRNDSNLAYYYRLHGRDIAIDLHLQFKGKLGHWRKPRPFNSYNDNRILIPPQDRLLLAVEKHRYSSFALNSENWVLQALPLLAQHDCVAWKDEFDKLIRVREEELHIGLEEQDGFYRPVVCLGDLSLTPSVFGDVYFGGNEGLVYCQDPATDDLLFAMMTTRDTILLFELLQTQYEELLLDPEMAVRFMERFEAVQDKTNYRLDIHENLSGTDQELSPDLELHFDVVDPNNIHIHLYLACHITENLLKPGVGDNRITVKTPVGRVNLIRDIEAEIQAADRCANELELERFDYVGFYHWKINSLEETLGLIERLKMMGDRAPVVLWPKGEEWDTVGEITPEILKVKLEKQHVWFGLNGYLEINGVRISLLDLLSALRRGSKYVAIGHGRYARISSEIRRRLLALKDVANQEHGKLKVYTSAAPIVEQALAKDIKVEADPSWCDTVARLRKGSKRNPKVPRQVKADLRDYQIAGYQWLSRLSYWGIGGILADDMGLGKTLQTLAILQERAADGPALIIAPTSVALNWPTETFQFTPELRPILFHETNREKAIKNAGPGDLLITSYQLFRRQVELFAKKKWHTLVLDEAQYIKNFNTKTSQAVRQLQAQWTLALSGTPLENHLGELWGLMRVVNPGLLGSWDQFRFRFAEPIERHKDSERMKALSELLQPYVLRRTKSEVLSELPPRTHVIRKCEFSKAEKNKYDAMRIAALSDIDTQSGKGNSQTQRIQILSWLTKLRQFSCHPALLDASWKKSSSKLDLFLEIVDELQEGNHRALVFSQFVQHLELVRGALEKRGIDYLYLDGSTPKSQRKEAIDAFQDGQGTLFLISLKAGGTGINLTSADYVIHLDPWWNPAVEDQATDRAHRIGQTKPVTVYRLVTKDSIEEQILALHDDKRELIANVLNGANRAGRLSSSELISLIKNQPESQILLCEPS